MNSTLGFTLICGLVGVWLTYRFKIDRDRADACRKFRSAFVEAKAILNNGITDAAFVMSKFRTQHDAAIVEFRYYVRQHDRKRFDAACEKYRKCRQEINPALLRHYEALKTGKPIDSGSTQKLMEAINEVLAFADKI